MRLRCLFLFLLSILLFCGCTGDTVINGTDMAVLTLCHKPVIVCTLFPQYDFARTIFGDEAEVVMLLKPGMESHMFDPTPQDMVTISQADAFVYTGEEMEPWAAQIVESLSDVKILDLSTVAALEMENHDHDEDRVDEAHHNEMANVDDIGHHGHEHSYDPHFWLNLDNAKLMVQAIGHLAIDMGMDASVVGERTEDYVERLSELDTAYFEMIDMADRSDIVFAGRFAYGYLVNRYGLSYETVYHTCAAEEDPSVYDMVRVMDYIENHQTKVIFYEELSSAAVAKTIAEDTSVQTRMLSTAHNVTKEEFDSGISFCDIISNNLQVLKEALEVNES